MDEHGAPLFYQTFLNNTWDQPKPITLQGIESLVVNAVESEKLRLAPGDAATAKSGRIKVTKNAVAANADTKGRSSQNRFGNISGNGCGKGTISVWHACGLSCVDDLHHNPPRTMQKQPKPQNLAEYLQDIPAIEVLIYHICSIVSEMVVKVPRLISLRWVNWIMRCET